MSKIFGIDISTWQKNYNYDLANSDGVKFAIIRAGFAQTKDNRFEEHYANAKRLNWGVGAYWYSYATTVEEAKAEARTFLKVLEGKQFDYPVYLDLEDKTIKKIGKSNIDSIVRAFGEIMENAGYYFGVYTNTDWYKNVISGAELNKKYDWWIAQWSSTEPTNINYGIWQFGGETNYIRNNKIAGVTTDQNYAYKDYPSIIKNKGLNGYPKKVEEVVNSQPEPKSIDELANEVIAGKWGNGVDRKNALANAGFDYTTVQNRVNEIMGQNNPSSASVIYTVQRGDSLSTIAKKFNTTRQEIYNRNKAMIDNDAKKHGVNANYHNFIYAGQVLNIK